MIRLIMAAMALGTPQAEANSGAPQPPTPAHQPAPILLLARDTPVELMAVAEVSTADALPGAIFKLRVNRAILVDGRMIVPVGTPAFGKVVSARDAGGLGKSGRMTAELLHIQLGEAEIPLEGQTSARGTGAGSAGVAVLFGGVMGLFHRGNNAKIKAGELLTGFVAEDVALDVSAARPRRVALTAVRAAAE